MRGTIQAPKGFTVMNEGGARGGTEEKGMGALESL